MSARSEGALDWNALAHRALATASLYDVLRGAAGASRAGAARSSRAGAAGASPTLACARASELASVRDADLVVTVDAPALDAASFVAAREAIAPGGIVALLIASTSAAGLLAAGVGHTAPASAAGRPDAFALATAWARVAARAPLAPAASASRIRELASLASASGLALVEPDVPHLRAQPKAAVDRAVLATVAFGATARSLLFVPEGRAPKGGVVRLREERVLDFWIEGRSIAAAARPSSLPEAALAELAACARPIRGKDLLREARARYADAARQAGVQVTASSTDGPLVARELVTAWRDGAVELWAADPATPLAARPPG
ncbi:MAG: hypothetical protein KF795_11860 [Labilithrix sp.]|nr:hypothetical protein [Labilithrix sp.]